MSVCITESLRQRWQAPFNRRRLLTGAAASLATLALWPNGHLPAVSSLRQRSMAELQFSDFSAVRGTRFRLYQPDGQQSVVELATVKASTFPTAKRADAQQACFSLAFDSTHSLRLPQGTYTFAHVKLGYFDLFIVPAQATEDTERYIAIINRLAA